MLNIGLQESFKAKNRLHYLRRNPITVNLKKMLRQVLLSLVICLSVVKSSRFISDSAKAFKSLPTISNSLVNLGKMDISFHFNAKLPDKNDHSTPDHKPDFLNPPLQSMTYLKPEQMGIEPCLCNAIKNLKNSYISSPTDILSKIISSNDIFSYNKDPASSPVCCESHEQVQEDTIYFEIDPKQNQHADATLPSSPNSPSFLPYIFNHMMPGKSSLPSFPAKPKAIEIFFFPNKRDMSTFSHVDKPATKFKKNNIMFVGDKESKNDYKTYKFRPSVPAILSKTDEQMPEKNEKPIEKQDLPREKESINTTKSNAI